MSSVNNPHKDLIAGIKNSVTTHLKEAIAEMFIKVDETLFEMANSADNNEDQRRFFELMHDTRTLKDDISVDFIMNIAPYLRPFAITEAEKKKKNPENADELSLVAQSDMEDMLLVKNMGGSIAGRFREQLNHLEARLEDLALKTPDIFARNALHPINIFQAFDDALRDYFDLTNKKILFKFFNDLVALNLGKTYDTINNLLIDAGILPQIKLQAKKSTSGRRPGQSSSPMAEPTADNLAQQEAEQNMNMGGYAMTAQPGHAYPGGAHGTGPAGVPVEGAAGGSAAGSSHAGGVSPGYSGGAQESAGTADPGPAGYQHITAGMPASQVGKIIGEFISGAPMLPPDPNASTESGETDTQYFPTTTGQYYGHQDILNALSSVQHNPAFSNAEVARYDGEAIKQAVLAEIAKTSGGAVTKQINKLAEKTIDFIELVFDAIIDDDNISDTIKTLLLRLQIPVIKASMIDQEFFIYDDHPARVLLDKIAHAGIGVNTRNDEIYIQLDKIVTKLVNEFELQADSFKKALDDLTAFLDEREADALKKEEEAQRQVLREHARNTVLKALRTATRGKRLPESIHALVLKRWPTMMYNHYLKQGKENDEWVTIVDTLRAIINSLQPLKNASDLEHLLETREKLIETTRGYLHRTNQSEEDIRHVIQNLIDIHQSLIESADFPAEQANTDNNSNDASTTASTNEPETDEEEDKTPKLQLPSNIVPGMWFQVYNGEDRAQRRCKLSVVILADQKLVFVNYQGEVILEKNLGDFLNEIAEGKSKVIMGHSVFDHALSSVVTNLEKKH
ncbi:MAG: DUF1631 domain-containing protein [Gammaproteobacteria bacterium]|nr:DUF1631 domain-containing protein [Gammaproteobacteria bacterium]